LEKLRRHVATRWNKDQAEGSLYNLGRSHAKGQKIIIAHRQTGRNRHLKTSVAPAVYHTGFHRHDRGDRLAALLGTTGFISELPPNPHVLLLTLFGRHSEGPTSGVLSSP